jgi:hypothetical protein
MNAKQNDDLVIEKTADLEEKPGDEPTVQPPTTPAGQPVEKQVRKEWEPNKDGGLPTF